MALNLQDKQAIVAEVSEVAKGALSAVVADSRGVTVDKMTELRKAGREADPIAMDDGLRFAIREGGRTVGAGVVAKVIA